MAGVLLFLRLRLLDLVALSAPSLQGTTKVVGGQGGFAGLVLPGGMPALQVVNAGPVSRPWNGPDVLSAAGLSRSPLALLAASEVFDIWLLKTL
jgi:hypothetical protein